MHDAHFAPALSGPAAETRSTGQSPLVDPSKHDVVSTHVLVPQEQVDKLRELSRKSRIAQSEYLREAVDDLLTKYSKLKDGE